MKRLELKKMVKRYNALKLGEKMSLVFIHGRHMITESLEGIKVAVFYINDFFVEVAYDIETLVVIDIVARLNIKEPEEILKRVQLNLEK